MGKKYFLFVCVLLASLYVQAQKSCGYAVFDASTNTLTFQFGTPPSGDNVYLTDNTSVSGPGWSGILDRVKKVIFDSSFANARPTSTAYWFSQTYNSHPLEEIVGLQYFNTSRVTSMHCMFYNCISLTSLDVSHFDTGNVTNMGSMFSSCSGLTSLDVSHFDTGNVTDMRSMFSSCSGLTTLDVTHFDTSKVTDMSYMFLYCSGLTSLDVSHFNTGNVTNMGSMFSSCDKMTSLDLSNFDTGNVTSMDGMFLNCRNLTSINLSHFDTGNVMFMGSMFNTCDKLTSLDLSQFDTSNVTDMSSMFNNCSGLTSLNVSHFETGNVSNMSGMFSNCSGLTSLDVSHFNTGNVSNMYSMFSSCSGLTSLDVSHFNTGNVSNMGWMFFNCSGLASLDLSSFDTGKVTKMESMFNECSSLNTIVVSNLWNTDNLESGTSGRLMFDSCEQLTGGRGTRWSMNNTDYMYARIDGGKSMPGYLTSNAELDIKYGYAVFDSSTGTLTFMYNTRLPGNNVYTTDDTGNQPEWSDISDQIKKVVFDPSFASARPTSTKEWFMQSFNSHPLEEIVDLQYLNTSKVTNMTGMFYYCSSLTSLDVSHFNTGNVISMSHMFYECSSLTGLDVSNFDTGEVMTMLNMFYDCSGLTSLDVSRFDTRNVQNMEGMFAGCSSLTSLDVSHFDTGNVKNMWSMFFDCSSLTSLDVRNFNTDKVVTMRNMFCDCINLTSLDVRNFNTSNVTSMSYMFKGCSSLTDLNLGSFDTNNVKDMFAMFWMCSSLKRLDLGNFNISNVTAMMLMFSDCNSLNCLILGYDFDINDIKEDNLFSSIGEKESCLLIVPGELVGIYKGAMNNGKLYGGNFNLQESKSATLFVFDEAGNDVTDNATILWYDSEGGQIGTGKALNGIGNGISVYYSVFLDEELGRTYHEVNMHKITVESETVTCKLEKIGRIMLEGRVSATDIENKTVTVNVKQMLNGKYEQTYCTQTDEQGTFKVEVLDDETDITISGEGYFDAILHRDGFGDNGNVGTIPLSLISGFAIAANISLIKAVVTGLAEDVVEWSDGLNNLEFILYNETKRSEISDFTTQNGNVIIKSGADVGNLIRLTAKSKQHLFADATMTFPIEEGTNNFSLILKELGGIDVKYASSSNSNTIGYLYDADNSLIAKGSYVGETLSLRHLHNGSYTLVSMGGSTLLGNMTKLSDLNEVGLNEGSDYVSTSVVVTDGLIVETNINEVPRMDDTRFYYTSGNTYFNTDKTLLTVGNYLTLSAHLDFKPEYADKANNVKLSIDLPEGCQMVENSVIANRQVVAYTIINNRLMMTLSKEQWQGQVRLCIIPTINQTYTLTAMASFDINGNVSQPIGTVQFEAKGLSLRTPKYAANSSITINGTAGSHSEISIYDNDVFIGKTSSKADGSWTATCELYKPYSHSFHEIYAKIKTKNGMELASEGQQVEYDKNMIVPQKVTMLYYNREYNKNYNIEFDLINGTTSELSYYYFPYKNWPNWYETLETEPKDFTFFADFTLNDETLIKNVNIKVLNSDGTVRTLPATFDSKQNKWVATTKYSSSSRLPQNVDVEYDLIVVNEEMSYNFIADDNNEFLNMLKNYVENIDLTKFKILEAKDNFVSCNYQTYTMDEPVVMIIEKLDYDQFITEMEKSVSFSIENNGIKTHITTSVLTNQYVLWMWSETNRNMYKMEIVKTGNTNKTRGIMPQPFWNVFDAINNNIVGNAVLNLFINSGDIRKICLEDKANVAELVHWQTRYNVTMNKHFNMYKKTKQMMGVRCPDGSLRLNENAYDQANITLDYCFSEANNMRQQFLLNLQKATEDINRKRTASSIISAAGCMVSAALGVATLGNEVVKTFLSSVGANIGVAFGTNGYSHFIRNEFYTFDDLFEWYKTENAEIINNYLVLQNFITSSYKTCKKDNDDKEEQNDEPKEENLNNNDDFNGKGVTPVIDPSGYVYEAVLSNRLEGVTATCYQKVQQEDMYGDVTETGVIWNAADYSQQNPLKTDAAGFYRWDVPQGMWQVKYEKEGYETAYSDWLPVPPPQLDVNIGMKQSTPPSVKLMRGNESGITIEMSKYMRPVTMNTEQISVTRNGKAVKGSIEFCNLEKEPYGDSEFVSIVKFVPETPFITSDEVIVTVCKEVESYCGANMTKDHVQKVKIEAEIKEIVAEELISIPYQGAKDIRIVVLPKSAAAGRNLCVKTSSAMIASLSTDKITVDDNGCATLTVNGEIPGSAYLTFTVENTDVTAESQIKVVTTSSDMVATPTASIKSGETINPGTLLTLSCDIEGVTIYYTLDGSCPCDETKRIKYERPIAIYPNMVVKANAIRDDLDDSDVATFVYNVTPMGDVNGDTYVNTTDINEVVNYIMNRPNGKFIKAAADMNGDGVIDAVDIVHINNIIMTIMRQ